MSESNIVPHFSALHDDPRVPLLLASLRYLQPVFISIMESTSNNTFASVTASSSTVTTPTTITEGCQVAPPITPKCQSGDPPLVWAASLVREPHATRSSALQEQTFTLFSYRLNPSRDQDSPPTEPESTANDRCATPSPRKSIRVC